MLLAAFAPSCADAVANLGAGCGALFVLLAARGLAGPFTAVELDPLAANCCTRNFAEPGLDGQVLEHNLCQDHPALPAGDFALVVSNPSFGRAAARHELTLEAEQLWARASHLLRPGERLACCLPPHRLPQALQNLLQERFGPQRLRLVHGREGKPASLALIEAVKDGGQHLNLEPPLMVYGSGQTYSPEVAAIYDSLE